MAYPPQDLLLRPVLRSDELPDHYLHAPRGYLGPNELDAKDPINYLVNLSANTSLFSRTDQAFAKRLLFQDPHHTTPTGRLEGIHFHAATGSVIALDLLKNLHARYAENEAHRSAFRPYVLDSQRANNSHQARLAVAVLEVFMLLALARNRRVRATFALNLDTFAFMQGKLSLTSTGAAAEWMVALTEAECELLATHATRWLFSEEQFRHIQGQQYQAGEYADSTMHTIARLLYQQCREISRAVLNATFIPRSSSQGVFGVVSTSLRGSADPARSGFFVGLCWLNRASTATLTMLNGIQSVVTSATPQQQPSTRASLCDTAEAAAFFAQCFKSDETNRDGVSLMLTGSAAIGAWYLGFEDQARHWWKDLQGEWESYGIWAELLAHQLQFVPIKFVVTPVNARDGLEKHALSASRRTLLPRTRSDDQPVNFGIDLAADTSGFHPQSSAFLTLLHLRNTRLEGTANRPLDHIRVQVATGPIIALDLLRTFHIRYTAEEEYRNFRPPRVLRDQSPISPYELALMASVCDMFLLVTFAHNPSVANIIRFNEISTAYGPLRDQPEVVDTGKAARWMQDLHASGDLKALATKATWWIIDQQKEQESLKGPAAPRIDGEDLSQALDFCLDQFAEVAKNVNQALNPRNPPVPTREGLDRSTSPTRPRPRSHDASPAAGSSRRPMEKS
ncbi:hypothetical protein JCM11641_002797 [Rhodosporidiobolus odoratus]